MTRQIQQDTPPCCICYTQKKHKSIIEYKCTRCNEGIVCEQCAIQLWTANSGGSCPICNNNTIGRKTWYKSYDIEMGKIKPPSINDSNIQDNDEDNVEDNNPVINLKDNICILSFIILINLFIAFIIGTVFKTIEGYCAWKCPSEDLAITIITSIAIGIIGIPLIALCLLFVIFFIGVIFKGIKFCSVEIYNKLLVYFNNISNNDRYQIIREYTVHYCKKFCYNLMVFTFGLLISWAIGTIYKLAVDTCHWNCENFPNSFTAVTSIIIGFLILVFATVICIILGLCSICCIQLGSDERR